MIRTAYQAGCRAALEKLALAPPTQVDEFVQNVEQGKDIPLPQAEMAPPPTPTALDGTTPLSTAPQTGALPMMGA